MAESLAEFATGRLADLIVALAEKKTKAERKVDELEARIKELWDENKRLRETYPNAELDRLKADNTRLCGELCALLTVIKGLLDNKQPYNWGEFDYWAAKGIALMAEGACLSKEQFEEWLAKRSSHA